MKKLKYVKLFEAYTDTDFETRGGGKETTGKFIGKLTTDDQNFLDQLKNIFGDESFKGISSSDGGAIVGSGAGKRDVDHIVFKFAFYNPTTILYVSNSPAKVNSYSISIEHPNNASENMEKEFKTKEELLKFVSNLGRFKKHMK
jgi:hypothetical protein